MSFIVEVIKCFFFPDYLHMKLLILCHFQVSRLLLGGVKVVGVYVWAGETVFKQSTLALCQVNALHGRTYFVWKEYYLNVDVGNLMLKYLQSMALLQFSKYIAWPEMQTIKSCELNYILLQAVTSLNLFYNAFSTEW